MALAEGKKLVDIGHLASGSAKQTFHPYLLVIILTHKEGQIGPWSFVKAHLALEDYDGISPLQKVLLNYVYFWVKIGNIPPAFDKSETIALIASIVSFLIELDYKLFRKDVIRVRVWHNVTKLVLLTKVVWLAAGVEAKVKMGFTSFTFSSQITPNLSSSLFANLQQVTVPSKGQIGPWSFVKAHLALEDYDGISPLQKVLLNYVYFWVKIGNIPPAFDKSETIALIASIVSFLIELDYKLFRKDVIRVRVWHNVTKLVLLTKVVWLAAGVEAKVSFFYEDLVGHYNAYGLIYHVGTDCDFAIDAACLDRTSSGTNDAFDFGSS
ncbi:hypothetical protein M0R45_015065 [Rubus argutus]|uniref:Uncharacterized protein n=1 Tax=Rubus argutus TaxID=59490 RepID=A0AAW1XNL7_RUBAR